MSIPNTLLPAVELEAGVSPNYAVLWLHGLGADGHDFVPIVNELALPSALSIRFVFPHAPMRPVSINQGMVMRAWHDYDMIDVKVGVQENMESLRSSQQAIEALIDRRKPAGNKVGEHCSGRFFSRWSASTPYRFALSGKTRRCVWRYPAISRPGNTGG